MAGVLDNRAPIHGVVAGVVESPVAPLPRAVRVGAQRMAARQLLNAAPDAPVVGRGELRKVVAERIAIHRDVGDRADGPDIRTEKEPAVPAIVEEVARLFR